MNKRLLVSIFISVFVLSIFVPTQSSNAQFSTGCPAPLQLKLTSGGAQCMMVYTDISQLPPGCTSPLDTVAVRLDYANNARSVECQPQAGYSIALSGDILPDGSFRCGVNIGWIKVGVDSSTGKGIYRWNGGCGAFSGTYGSSLPQPNGPMPEDIDRCDSTEALASGSNLYTSTNASGSTIAGNNSLTRRDACIAYAGMKSCNIPTNNPVFDPSFSPSTCCDYGVNPNISVGGIITGCYGEVVSNGGAPLPWTGTEAAPRISTSGNTSYANLFAQMNTLSRLIATLTASLNANTEGSGGAPIDTSAFDASNTFIQGVIERTRLAQINSISGKASAGASGAITGSVSGYVTVTVARLNVRSTPSSTGSLVRVASLGESISVASAVVGESVEGVSRWWKMSDGNYIWSGGTTFPTPGAAGAAGAGSGTGTGGSAGAAGAGSGNTGGGGGSTGEIVYTTFPITASDGSIITGMPIDPDCAIQSINNLKKNGEIVWSVQAPIVQSTNTVANIFRFMDCTSQFAVGQRVQTNSNLNVRATPSTLNGSLGVQNMGVAGTIVGGGIFAGTHYWWNINYDTGVDGWSAQDYLFGN